MSGMSEKPRLVLSNIPYIPPSSNTTTPSTPPPYYTSGFSANIIYSTPPNQSSSGGSSSSTSIGSSSSMSDSPSPKRNMSGGMNRLYNRPTSPTMDEKRGMSMSEMEAGDGRPKPEKKRSIEVPGIILTEPPVTTPFRTPSPPPKSILLLSPSQVSLPLESSKYNTYHMSSIPSSRSRPYSPTFAALLASRNGGHGSPISSTTIRVMILLVIAAICAFHVWSSMDMDMGAGIDDIVEAL